MDKNIPVFPVFEKIETEHRNIFDEYLGPMEPAVSEFNFTEIFMWRKIRFSILNGSLCIMLEKNKKKFFYRPLGRRDTEKTVRELLEWGCKELGDCSVYGFLEEELPVLGITDKNYDISSDRADSDYLYRASDLIELVGRKYDGKRNHIKRFEEEYEVQMEEISPGNARECLAFQRKWYEMRGCEDDMSLAYENCAVIEVFENFENLPVFGALMRFKKEIIGYTLADKLNDKTAIIIAEKADYNLSLIHISEPTRPY